MRIINLFAILFSVSETLLKAQAPNYGEGLEANEIEILLPLKADR